MACLPMALPLRVAALALLLAVLGCGSTFRPVVPTRIDVPEARIDVVEARVTSAGTISGALSAEVVLRTRMPFGTRLRQIMFVNARLRACAATGLAATAIRLDDGESDAGVAVDVAGEHRIVVTFASAGPEVLAGPVALDWYDDVNGEPRCGRIALVDSEPQHAWTNESRWSVGLGTRLVVPLEPIHHVAGVIDFPALVRYRTSERGALVGTLGLVGASFCRSDVCSRTANDGYQSGLSLPLGVGYDHTLLHSGTFALGLGARYGSRLTWVALRTGTDTILIHELVAVPRLALVGPRLWPSGLPGTSHGTSIDVDLPVGLWAGGRMRDTSLVLGGILSISFAL